MWPEAGFTKGQMIDYYARVSEALLPHLSGRPLTRVRLPDGVDGQRFFEKRAPSHTPKWVRTAPIVMGREGELNFIVCNNVETLTWLAQLAALELHPSLALAKNPDRPTVVAFDLDPGPPADAIDCCRVALRLREMFSHFGVESFPKTSGSKGLQVYVPLNTELTYDVTKPYAQAVARLLERMDPDGVTSRMTRRLRRGKVFVDWSQNDESKTTVAVYSLRARDRPTVSAPLHWDEVAAVADRGDPDLVVFEAHQVLERVADRGELFAPVLSLEQDLPGLEAVQRG
jgi:bifunctional non-homologous end joining protein LigD